MANNVKFKSPALPIPPAQYNQSLYQRTFSILRLYFNQLDEHLRQDLGDTTINGDLTVTGGVTAGDTTVNGALTVNNDLASIISTDAGAGAAPVFELYRNSASPADEDLVGQIQFQGENDADEKYLYASISGKISDATNNSENGTLEFNVGAGGSMLTIATIDQTRGVDTGSYGIRGGYFVIGSDSAYAPNNVINGGLTINNFGSNDNLELVDTNSSNTNSDPRVSFYRDSSSPADNDHAGRIEFYANNDADQKTNTAGILNRILDVTDGTEDGELTFSVMQAGTSNTLLTLDPNGVTATGATTVNGALTATNDYHQFRSTNTNTSKMPLIEVFRDKEITTSGTVGLGGFVFTGRNEDDRKVSYGSFYCNAQSQLDDGEQKAALVFTVADGSGAVDPFTDYTNNSFATGHSVALNITAEYFITTGYLKSDVGELKLGPKQAIKESALSGDVLQSTYDLHMPEGKRAKVIQIGGIGPFDSFISGNQSVADMMQYRGQHMLVASGGALEFELPACAASSDISTTTCNIGDIFQISNATGGALTIDRDGSGTAQTIYYFPSLTLTAFTNNPTLAVGGTMMLQAVAADVWMVFNDSGLSDA
jgi:hypothetical protein